MVPGLTTASAEHKLKDLEMRSIRQVGPMQKDVHRHTYIYIHK